MTTRNSQIHPVFQPLLNSFGRTPSRIHAFTVRLTIGGAYSDVPAVLAYALTPTTTAGIEPRALHINDQPVSPQVLTPDMLYELEQQILAK